MAKRTLTTTPAAAPPATVHTLASLPVDRQEAVRDMSRVSIAAAVVLGQEAGFHRDHVLASQFAVLLGMLHVEFRLTPREIAGIVLDAFKPDA